MNHFKIFAIFQLVTEISFTLSSAFNTQDYQDQLTKPYFVDKSMFIKAFFDSGSSKILLSSPRGFGKTLNLQMFQLFVEIELDEYGVPKHSSNTTAGKIFKNLTISQYPEIVNEHMAKYPVLFLDLEAKPVLESYTREDIIRHVNNKLYDTFVKHSWMLQIPEDVLVNHYRIDKNKIKFMKQLDERNLENENEKDYNVLHKMLHYLAVILRSYYRNGVIILVDNYDSMVSNSYKPSGQGVSRYYDHVNGLLQRAFEDADESVVVGGLVMGISGLVLANLPTFLSRTKFHPFMGEESKFTEFFGFQESELVQLLDRYKCPEKLDEIRSYFNGYKTVYQDLAIFNPSSVIQYLGNLSNDPLRIYWRISTVDNFLLSFMNDTLIRTVIRNVINNASTGYHMAEAYTADNFNLFFSICENYAYNSTDQGLLLWFFYDHGYLSHRVVETDSPGQFLDAMGAPNFETRRALEQLMTYSGPHIVAYDSL
ncbi:uncharacterized protein LOC135845886 [Planococcus citri]|uniref:uncharacterized protein LOC135845886 n=1 Tax=Planococcus citri TaxID=170843 RepID=UPI0031F86F54